MTTIEGPPTAAILDESLIACVPEGFVLRGWRCESCGRLAFGRKRLCPSCGSGHGRETRLASQARLETWTRVVGGTEYVIGYGLVGDGEDEQRVRVFAPIDVSDEAGLSAGQSVEIRFRVGAIVWGTNASITTSLRGPQMGDACVIGIGMTRFTQHDEDAIDLGVQAVTAALDDAGIGPHDVDALYAGHVHGGMVAGERVGAETGLAGIPTVNVENACASGTTAVIEAVHAVRTGRFDCVVACGFEKVSDRKGMITPAEGDYEGALGLVFPAWHAMRARLYMDEYGLTRDQLSLVAVKNRHNGALNPLSHFKEEVTVDVVARSREIATPLRLYDCCPKSDGGAAIVISSTRPRGRSIAIRGTGLASGRADGNYEALFEDVTARAARAAYDEAGIEPDDVDFAEVHDCFTIAEGLRVEGLGLAERGTYFRQLEEGRWTIDGRTPVNASGGLLAKGHPLGATGVGQVCEIATQMRGDAGDRQLERTNVAVAHTRGGSVPGTEGGSCGVLVCVAE